MMIRPILFAQTVAKLFVGFCVMFVAGTAHASDYYVDSQSGNDNNSGLTGSPVRTVTKGLQLATGGDTVHLRGKYYNEWVVFPKSGSVNRPIVLDGEWATIEGPSWL